MKKSILILITILSILQLSARPKLYVNNGSKRYLKVHPNAPDLVFVRPSCPGPNHVWIDGDWVWSTQANQYIYVQGKWIVPNNNAIWVAGRWKNTKHGWHWIDGHWSF